MKLCKLWRGILWPMLMLSICVMLLPVIPAYGADSSKAFSYDLSINGEHEVQAHKGEILTVSVYLKRTDSEDPYEMYSMQDEIRYSDAFMKIVDGSLVLGNEIVNTDIELIDGDRSFYLNYLSLGNGKEWEANKLLASFQVEILADSGEYTLHSENGLVAVPDGSDTYEVANEDVTIVVSRDGKDNASKGDAGKATNKPAASNGGSVDPLYLVIAGLVAVIAIMGVLLFRKSGKEKSNEK